MGMSLGWYLRRGEVPPDTYAREGKYVTFYNRSYWRHGRKGMAWSRSPIMFKPCAGVEGLRRQHHKTAFLIADGGLSDRDVATACRIRPSSLAMLCRDPSFQELVSYYADGGEYRPLGRASAPPPAIPGAP